MTDTDDHRPEPDPTPSLGLALVTGASSGIGLEIARVLAAEGHDLLAVADEPEIHDAVRHLEGTGVHTAMVADLTDPEGVEQVVGALALQTAPLTTLVLNAGTGVNGPIADHDVEDDLRVVDLDVRSVVHLAGRCVPRLVEQGAGRVMVVSSIAADAPGPFHATYAASKAFVHSYAEALRVELAGSGVTVTSVKPGPVDTRFFERAGMQDTRIAQGPKDDAAVVARQAVAAMERGAHAVVPGNPLHKVTDLVAAVVPERVKALVAAIPVIPGGAH